MQNRTLSLSLLISAALAIPSLAMAAPVDMTSADVSTTTAMPTDTMVEEEAVGPNGELLATQPGYVESDETQVITPENQQVIEPGTMETLEQAPSTQYEDPNYQLPADMDNQ